MKTPGKHTDLPGFVGGVSHERFFECEGRRLAAELRLAGALETLRHIEAINAPVENGVAHTTWQLARDEVELVEALLPASSSSGLVAGGDDNAPA